MAKFKYKAVRQNGESYEGLGEYADKFALYKEFKKNGQTVLYAKEMKRTAFALSTDIGLILGRVRMADKIAFARNLGAMIEAGLSLNRALSVIERQAKGAAFKKIIGGLIAEVNSGKELSYALGNYSRTFPPLFISMVRSGEASGTLATALRSVAAQLESTYTLKKKVHGALIYPAVILCLIVVVAILMLVYVVPTLSSVFKDIGSELPFSTRLIIGASEFFKVNWAGALAGLILLIIAFVFGRRFRMMRWGAESFVLRLPLVSTLIMEVNSARTARTLSSLLSAGVDVLLAMDITKDVVQNLHYTEVIDQAKGEIQKGSPISRVFSAHESLYPPFVGEMISVGEETGKLGSMLGNLAAFYETEVEQKTKNLSTVIEPLLMIVIGTAVGAFAYAMLTPIYSIVGSIQ